MKASKEKNNFLEIDRKNGENPFMSPSISINYVPLARVESQPEINNFVKLLPINGVNFVVIAQVSQFFLSPLSALRMFTHFHGGVYLLKFCYETASDVEVV